jgi:hypothetical protein
MNSPVENILQDLFKTSSLQDVSAEELLHVINDHPYNGSFYFLLAKKLYASKEPGFENALQKAALHFGNHTWFNFNLIEDEKDEPLTDDASIQTKEIADTKQTESEADNATDLKFDESIVNAEEKNATEEITAINTEDALEEYAEEELPDENIEADHAINERLSSMLKEQASNFEKPVEATAEIPIENTPYHRVDYFDSQGIKLEEGKADDKLGTQLKRFTDWLKQMKRVNANPAELAKDEVGESKVQTLAEHSNESEEIATETMAEVLIKQGKPEQAIQIYEKLSFINPSKSAYFAAKIEELKG